MKYVIIIPDGCADESRPELDGKTPLEAANLPAMDAIATTGVVGWTNHVPQHLPAGSAVANMSLLGYDPNEHFSGRAPLEAAAQGIQLGEHDWAVRCNLVTIENQTMCDFTADHISSEEAASLLNDVQEKLGSETLQFETGVSYRNLLIYRGNADQPAPFSRDTRTTPPHDLIDLPITDDFPRGPGSDLLNDLMGRSVELFEDHPINLARIKNGKRPATNLWLWGLGKTPKLKSFAEVYHLSGAMITAVDLLRGIAKLIGWQRIEVPGATGYTDTDYRAKGEAAITALADHDLVCVHIEATDEASHEGDTKAKVLALEEIDRHIIGPVHKALQSMGEYRILVCPDHPTPLGTKMHSHGTVPFTICGTSVQADENHQYDDPTAIASALSFEQGCDLMRYFVKQL